MKRKNLLKTISIMTASLFLIPLLSTVSPIFAAKASSAGSMTFTYDFNNTGEPVKDVFSTLNQWDYGWYWTYFADDQPGNYFSENYPFVKTVELMVATGGSAERDLYDDPYNRTVTDDYNINSLIHACQNVLIQGLKPYIKTGNVPLKLSEDPSISDAFSVNVRPPYDYELYYDYIRTIAAGLVAEFGLAEVRSWPWCVLTEFENKDWFHVAGDDTGVATKEAYLKLYDYTAAALQDVLGVGNFEIGAHGMVCSGPDDGWIAMWDPRDLLTHCATGTNYVTGTLGTQIDFITFSQYDGQVGVPVESFGRKHTLTQNLNFLHDRANALGLTNLKYGIDEGYVLSGSDGYLFQLSHMTAATYQGAYTARHFKEAVEGGLDWYSLWLYNTNGVWGADEIAANAVTTHIAKLGSKMAGGAYVGAAKSGVKGDFQNQVDGFASYNSGTNTIHVMAYNFNHDDKATSSENITVALNNIAAVDGTTVNVRRWYVDDDSNWWSEWRNDSSAMKRWPFYANFGSGDGDYVFSSDSIQQPISMFHGVHKEFWYSNIAKYIENGILTYTDSTETIIGNALTLTSTLKNHGTMFYEITNVKNMVSPGTAPVNNLTLSGTAVNGADTTTIPDFSWNAVAGATGYTLEVSINSNFSAPVISQTIRATSFTPVVPLANNTTYYWRVTAHGTALTASSSFTTRGTVPIPFTQLSPGWADVVSVTPTLTWEVSAGATSYVLIISPYDNLNNPIVNETLSARTTSYTVTTPLNGNTEYYWTVIAVNGAGSTAALSWKQPFNTVSSEPIMVDDFDNGLNKTVANLNSGIVGGGGSFWNDFGSNAALWETPYGLWRQDPPTSSNQYIVYKFDGVKSLRVTGLFADDVDPIYDFVFSTSPNGSSWTPLAVSHNDDPLRGGLWTKRIYATDTIPAGTNYIKIEFGVGGAHWQNVLSQVILSSLAVAEEPKPMLNEIIDDFDSGLNKTRYASSQIGSGFWNANNVPAEPWISANSLFRANNTSEYIVYELAGVKSIQATGLFGDVASNISDFKFYTSPNYNNKNEAPKWTELVLTSNNYEDEPLNGGAWTRRNYTFGTLPEGANFVKIEFGLMANWQNRLDYVALRKVSMIEANEIIDDFLDWSNVFDRTTGVQLIGDAPNVWEEANRVRRTDSYSGLQHLDYRLTGVKSFQVTGLFAHGRGVEPIVDFTFFTSPDGTTWTTLPLTAGTVAVTPLANIDFEKRVYDFNSLPDGTNYIRIQFRADGDGWRTQLSQVILSKTASEPEPEPEPDEIIDDLDDWSKAHSKTAGLDFITGLDANWEDNSRVFWWEGAADQTPGQHIVYKLTGMRYVQVNGLFGTNNAASIQNFTFWSSPDGANWMPLTLTSSNYKDDSINNGDWTKRVYSFDNLPVGTAYIKIQFEGNTWAVQLGQVIVSKTVPEPNELIDDFLDWTKVNFITAGLELIDDMPSVWEDTWRVRRVWNYSDSQYIDYKLSNIKSLQVTGLFSHGSGAEPIVDFTFFISTDGTTWTTLPLTVGTVAVTPLANIDFEKRVYDFNSLPAGTNYVRIQFRADGDGWRTQLSKVILSKTA